MKVHSRYRRNSFNETGRSSAGVGRVIARLILLGAMLLLVYWIGRGLLRLVGLGSGLQDRTATLLIEQGSAADVSYEGKQYQTAESNGKLQPGDAVKTAGVSNASLTFFDGTWVRLDQQSQLSIDTSGFGSTSQITLSLADGTLWTSTPDPQSFTDAITRRIVTPVLTYELPPGTDALVSSSQLIVYKAGNNGVTVSGKNVDDITIGEGQQLRLPSTGSPSGNLSAYRSALTLASMRNAFALDSQDQRSILTGQGRGITDAQDELLTVSSPQEGANVTGDSVRVSGKVSPRILTLRANGKEIRLSQEDGSFADDIVIPEGENRFSLRFEGLGSSDKIIAEKIVNVTRGAATASSAATGGFPSPVVTAPAKSGETYKTTDVELVLRGTTDANTASIVVNDYTLKLYTAGNATWSYLASLKLGNLKAGTNTFDIVALDKDGKRSTPATITIVQGEAGGVVAATSSAAGGSTSSTSSIARPKNNAPLTPGILKVTGPTPGTEHAETGTGFLLEGTTSKGTTTMWVNDYRLQLYVPGRKTWNYIASTQFANLKKGKNIYTIVARNENGEVLDKMEYTVMYDPAGE